MYQGNWPVPRSQWAVEVRKFLDTRPRDTIEAQVPADLDVHLIVDNYATHKRALIRNCSGRWSIRSSAEVL